MSEVLPEHQLAYNFAQLFQGNDRAYGTEAGGCDRGDPDLTTAGRWNDYMDRVDDHLAGRRPMGVYPMVYSSWPEATWRVHWGAVDFDEGEDVSLVHARNVVAVLRELEITGWIERSRSKGFHVFVFADSWVPARTMRRALLAACQVVDAPTREINPKQETLKEGQLGNYLRLPYPGALRQLDTGEPHMAGGPAGGRGMLLRPSTEASAERPSERPSRSSDLPADERQGRGGASASDRWRGGSSQQAAPQTQQQDVVDVAGSGLRGRSSADVGALPVDGRAPSGADQALPRRVVLGADGRPMDLESFVAAALATRVGEAELDRAAALYEEPVRPRPQRTEPTPDMLSSTPVARLSPVALMIYRDGPLEGSGRGHTLWKLARLMREDGRHTFDEALELLLDADERWGKFTDRGDAEYLIRMLEQAWAV